MIGTLRAVALDCPEPAKLAAFYAELVGGTIDDQDPEWFDLNREDGQRLSFQLAPDHQPPVWQDPQRPQQIHLDIGVPREELDAAQERVLALGATFLEGDLDGARNWRVYADPAGHPFCLCAC